MVALNIARNIVAPIARTVIKKLDKNRYSFEHAGKAKTIDITKNNNVSGLLNNKLNRKKIQTYLNDPGTSDIANLSFKGLDPNAARKALYNIGAIARVDSVFAKKYGIKLDPLRELFSKYGFYKEKPLKLTNKEIKYYFNNYNKKSLTTIARDLSKGSKKAGLYRNKLSILRGLRDNSLLVKTVEPKNPFFKNFNLEEIYLGKAPPGTGLPAGPAARYLDNTQRILDDISKTNPALGENLSSYYLANTLPRTYLNIDRVNKTLPYVRTTEEGGLSKLAPSISHTQGAGVGSKLLDANALAKIKLQTNKFNHTILAQGNNKAGASIDHNSNRIIAQAQKALDLEDMKGVRQNIRELNTSYDDLVKQYPLLKRSQLPRYRIGKNNTIKETNLSAAFDVTDINPNVGRGIDSGIDSQTPYKSFKDYFYNAAAVADDADLRSIVKSASDQKLGKPKNYLNIIKNIQAGDTTTANSLIRQASIASDQGRVFLKDGGNVEKAGVEDAFREHFSLGGLSGDRTNSLGSTGMTNFGGLSQKSNDKVGTIQSLLSGIAAGIIDIPKGAFTLGAALMDLGMGSNNAAKVESFFDDLTTFDEKAEATTVGSLARIFTNLGIPGSQGWKLGKTLARKAIDSKKAGTYFKVSRPDMEGRMQEALTTGGKLLTTAGGAAGIGVADAIFVGDPESVGTLGDAFSIGPTQLDPNSDTDPSREVLNRIKFGLDSSLMLGVLAGTGSAMGKVIARNKGLESNNKTLDKLFSKFRPRGDKPQEFFNLERQQIGIRQADVNRATELQRNVDRHIDKIFPFIKGALNRTKTTDRADLMKQLNETLLSGELIDDVAGGLKFTPMNEASRVASINKLKSLGAGKKEIDGIFGAFEDMRTEWGEMFGYLGRKMSADDLASFKAGFGKKFGDYLGSTYEVFKNKSLIPMFNFAPGREAIKKGMNMFKDSAEKAGKKITDEQAEYYVNQVVESARPPQRLSTKAEQNAGVYFNAPDFFGNKTTLHELDFKGKGLAINDLQPGAKQIVGEILGKVDDPMSTMLAGTGKLSLLTRRNQFFDKLLDESNLAREIDPKTNAKVYPDKKQMFFDDEAAAVEALGNGNVKVVGFDPGGKMQIGDAAHRLNGMFAHKGIVDALSETSTNILGDGMLGKLYTNLILYPKATSQLAKTVLSPITHVRNVVSAGAFATANGIFFPVEGKAMKEAYKALQFGGRTDAAANAMYQKLLKLGVVNTNVRLGDLQRLLTDVKFGEGTSNMTALRGLTKKLSKLKKGAEDLYTAEDDFWKITSWAVERNRYDKAFRKAGITDFDAYAKTRGFDKYDDFLDETAADIVRNNIPNYDYVNEFVKGLRKLPIGNFVSFPAEIMRTSANILSRGFREITEEITLPDGRKVKPFSGIGYQRLIGFGATTVAVPAAVTETFKMAYNVSEDEMDALRRFVPDWSKNSTLVPIRDDETGNLKYVDFSHANAYDTMIRPFTTILNNVRDGAKDEAPVMESMMRGMFEATKELGSPFISESIWSQAATDIIVRGGRTRTGQRLYTDQTPVGEKVQKIVGHLVEAQLPGSIESFKRLDLAIEPIDIIQRGKFDKYGKTYELGDELAGFVGLRAVEVNPVNAMKFKIADFRTGVNNARREFTQPLLRGGPVTPEQIVDRYQIANEQTYKVQQNMFKDYYAARVLGTGESVLDREFKDRISNVQLAAIKNAQFKPFIPSENIIASFAENARAIGQRSPYTAAQREIERLLQQYNALPLTLEQFPISVNPFSVAPELPTSGMNLTGGNLPQLNTTLQGSNIGGINNLSNTLAKIEQVDKVFDL